MSVTYPISLDQAKRHLRVGDLASDDELIQEDLAMAFSIAESWTNRNIIPQSMTETHSVIETKIYLSEIASVTAVKDSSGNAVTYSVTTDQALLTIITVPDGYDEVQVSYTVGYTSDSLPGAIRAAILLILGTLYDNEADVVVGRSVSQIPLSAKSLLAPYRIVNM